MELAWARPPPINRLIFFLLNSLLDPPVNRLVQEPCLTSPVICAVHALVTCALIHPVRSLVRAPGHSWGHQHGARPGDLRGAWGIDSPVDPPGARTRRPVRCLSAGLQNLLQCSVLGSLR